MARKYHIETFGCQMNVHDSERMAGLLEQAGFEATEHPSEADLVVINTCSVREHAEDKLYTRLGELRQHALETGHDPVVAIAGCVAQQEGEALLKRSPGVAEEALEELRQQDVVLVLGDGLGDVHRPGETRQCTDSDSGMVPGKCVAARPATGASAAAPGTSPAAKGWRPRFRRARA